MRVIGLGALSVMLGRADPAGERDSDDEGRRLAAPRTEPVFGDVAYDLVEGRVGEPFELHLGDRVPPGQGQPERDPGDGGLRERRVEHALHAELLL